MCIYFHRAAGCENGCSRHGQCTLEDGEYRCVCIDGWAGTDCSLALEMNCSDNIDNDHGMLLFVFCRHSLLHIQYLFDEMFDVREDKAHAHARTHANVPLT